MPRRTSIILMDAIGSPPKGAASRPVSPCRVDEVKLPDASQPEKGARPAPRSQALLGNAGREAELRGSSPLPARSQALLGNAGREAPLRDPDPRSRASRR